MGEVKPRKWWAASLLSFLMPGLGQIYNGQIIKGFVLYLVPYIVTVLSAFIIIEFSSALSLYLFVSALVSAHVYIVIEAGITARKRGHDYRLKMYNKHLVYVAVYLIFGVLINMGIGWSIRDFIIQAYKIPSGAMEPTLLVGDHIIIDKFPFSNKRSARGDIVVFEYPEDPSKDFIKRVVGVPGDVVSIRDKQLYINDERVQEEYVMHADESVFPSEQNTRDNYGPIEVPAGSLFTMGDNRDRSLDSRFWGFVDQEKVKGKALIIYWSWDADESGVRWERIGKSLL